MKKHAYLIMAYNHAELLKKLITLLDDVRNDIFIHIDLDSDFPINDLMNMTKNAKLYFINRISIRWAEYSQVEAELRLLKAATKNDKYHYYHLLSGMDMPLKTQNEIHDFFEDKHNEFIATVPKEGKYQIEHVKYYYPLLKFKSFRKSKILKLTSHILVKVQKILNVSKIKKFENMHFYDGWTWFSITDDFARFVLSKESEIYTIFKNSKAPDEMVFQTLAMNSEFKVKLYSITDLKEGSMRFIDWKRGSPYVWKEKDFNELIDSPYMFARKFVPEKIGGGITDMLYQYILDKQNLYH